MNEETNENAIDGIEVNDELTLENDIENAFSDLISEFFEEGNTTQTAGNINTLGVVGGETVTTGDTTTQNATGINVGGTIENAGTYQGNGETTGTGVLYNNLGTIGTDTTNNTQGTNGVYTTINTPTGIDGQTGNNLKQTGIYDEAGKLNTDAIVKNAYGVVTLNGEVINNLANKAKTTGTTTNVENIGETLGTDFKLTQGNLPAKIGFWTKVRNFFMPEAKSQYSVKQTNNTNTGVWNKIQNFFSFGNK